MTKFKEFFYLLRLRWIYKGFDPDVCCCGANMGEGGSICGHGGCRSAKEYAIDCDLERYRRKHKKG